MDDDAVEVCTPNIGPNERRKRFSFGVVTMVIAGAAAAILVVLGLSRWWRLALALPLMAGATGIFQAREKT